MKSYREILHEYWGYDSFRGIQEDIINSIGNGHDTLGLMPTGGGKSITFQVPALAQEGLCLVITPLIALMKDQVQNLKRRGIKATAIFAGMTRDDIIRTLDNCIFGDYKFLYISPERLETEIFQTKLQRMHISFITVDEAHCISQWGYDFRPSYLQIAEIRKALPGKPILALTATATPPVVKDIQRKLLFDKERVFRMSFERENLAYVVRQALDKDNHLLHILHHVQGSAIVYMRYRIGTQNTTKFLVDHGFTAEYYHAGLSNFEKDERQRRWQSGETRIMVATNAFGMGIDKPDVRLVIHVDMPDSPEAYFQEAGRAGRDGQRAYAVLLYNGYDEAVVTKRINDNFPEKSFIRKIYEDLGSYFQMAVGDGLDCTLEFNLEAFCSTFKHKRIPTNQALNLLSRAGYIDYTDEVETVSRLMFILEHHEIHRLHTQEPALDALIQRILRQYGGVFTDYIPISEDILAAKLGTTRQQVCEGLFTLSSRRILHYVPGKKTPYITYTQRRIESRRVVIPHTVYEERRKRFAERIDAMLHYATSSSQCRSQMLLRYFGEYTQRQCQHCDVCQQRHASGLKQGEFENIRQTIIDLLADGKPHSSGILQQIPDRLEQFKQVFTYLIKEEEILNDGGYFILAPHLRPPSA